MSIGLDSVDTGLAGLDRAAVEKVLAAFRAGSVARICQLSPLQQGLLFETLKNPGDGNYVTQTVYEVDEDLDHETFIAAWRFVCARHDALRTTFVVDDVPHPIQVVHRTTPAQVRVHDWSADSAEEEAARLELLLLEHRHGEPELSVSPPVSFDLIKVADGRHRIVWHVHHLLIDGASSAKVLDELALTYACLADRGDYPTLPQPAQFGDHLTWLAARDQEPDVEEWRSMIGDLAEPTPLSCAVPGGEEADHLSRSIVRTADSAFVAGLSDFAGRHNCTVHTVLQAAWGLVVASRGGRSDVCWGTIFSGRSADYSRVSDVVGLVINTVPIRTMLDPAESVGSWLRRLQQTLATARRLEHVGLDRIRRVSAVTGGAELFQTLFQFVPEDGPRDDGHPRLGLRRVLAVEQAGYPLDMSVVLRGHDELVMHLTFEPARVEPDVATQIADQYQHLLHKLLRSADTPLSEIELLAAGERDQIAAWSRHSGRQESTVTLTGLFAEAVAAYGDHTAVLDEAGSLSYPELDSLSDLVAVRLAAAGVRRDAVVGVAMPRTSELIVVLIGILKAGGAYLVLDQEAPEERRELMLSGSRASLVIAAADAGDHSPSALPERCPVLDAAALLAARPADEPRTDSRVAVHPDMLAFVTFTSGSTGIPKCVGLSHRNLARIGRHSGYIASGPGRRFLQLAPVAFDASVEEIWGSLLNGATLVMPGSSRLDLPDIADLCKRYEITNVSITTPLFHQFVDEQIDAFQDLDQVLIGGDAARRPQCDRALARHPALSLINTYGPTEMTTTTTSDVIEYQPGTEVPIGRPLPNATVYVLDDHLRRVPAGVPGQLYAGGMGLTRGYLNDPGLTAQRFLPDPFSAVPGARMYATGDQVRWLPDGRLEFIGRVDRQVKIRGFRVEPGEIEARLAEHPAVREAVVETADDAGGLRRLIAYVVPAPGAELTAASIRSFVAERLPSYMVPSLVAVLEKMPLTSVGKIDRARLPRAVEPAPADVASSREAESQTERILAAAWERALGIKGPGMADNFFERGGDSILAMRVASAARHEGLVMASTDLFKYQTIEELAAVLDARDKPVPADQTPVAGEVRLTPIQHWFLEHHGAQSHFNQSRLLRWADAVSEPALRRALRALTDHHDALRLRVARDGRGWRQRFLEVGSQDPLEVHDLRDVPDDELDCALRAVGDDVQRGLDLRDGPVIRAALIRTGARFGDLLLLAIHHMAVDLVSWNILLADLAGAYRSALDGRAVALPTRTASFKAWSDYLHDLHGTASASASERYRGVAGTSNPESALVPCDQDAGTADRGIGSVRLALTSQETQRFLRATRGKGKVSALELLLSSAIPALREWGCTGFVPVEMEVHGREAGTGGPDVTRTVGWFTACYPVTLDVRDVNTFGTYVTQVRDQIQRDPQQVLGYGIAKYLPGPDGARHAFPDSEICFNHLGEMGSGDVGESLFVQESRTLGAERLHDDEPAYLLDITTGVDQERLFLDIVYPARHWRAETVQTFADLYLGHIRRSIGQVATWELDRSHPSTWLARLRPGSPLLTAPLKQYRVPGISVATITGGDVEAWAHGASGRDGQDGHGGQDIDVHTMFPTGSVAKHYAAIVVLRLCEAGALDLDQPVDELPIAISLPTFPDGAPLTMRHLLGHRSGLVAGTTDPADRALHAVRPPGQDYEYSMLNFTIVERIIEEITGRTFAESLADHIFGPLGLTDSELLPLYPDQSQQARTAAGHSATGRRYARPRRAADLPDDLELWSSAADIARVGADLHRALARDEGVLLTRASALELLGGLRSGYGLGTVVRELNSRLWIGHPGDGPGFRTIYAVDAYDGYGLVILANGDGATPLFEDLLVELGTELIMRVQGPLMVWEKG